MGYLFLTCDFFITSCFPYKTTAPAETGAVVRRDEKNRKSALFFWKINKTKRARSNMNTDNRANETGKKIVDMKTFI